MKYMFASQRDMMRFIRYELVSNFMPPWYSYQSVTVKKGQQLRKVF